MWFSLALSECENQPISNIDFDVKSTTSKTLGMLSCTYDCHEIVSLVPNRTKTIHRRQRIDSDITAKVAAVCKIRVNTKTLQNVRKIQSCLQIQNTLFYTFDFRADHTFKALLKISPQIYRETKLKTNY